MYITSPLSLNSVNNWSISKLSIIILLTLSLLTGCGLFSNDDNTEVLPKVEYGLLNHGGISGLIYETSTLEGKTNSIGSFEYREDETITFKVGDIELASIPVHANLTLLDFDPAYDRNGDSFIPSERVINILQYLHTISDSSYQNDINITPEIHAAATGQFINFDQSNETFSADLNVLDVVSQLTNVRRDGERELIDAFEVQVILTENLSLRYGDNYKWEDILNLKHANQWTYSRTVIENDVVQSDTTSSFMLESAWHNEKIWIQGWSDNWKPNQYLYIAEELFIPDIHVVGYQNSDGVETILEPDADVLHSMFVPEKWLVYNAFINNEIVPAYIKIENHDELDVAGTIYSDVIKYTIKLPDSTTMIERWYENGVGMVKEISTSENFQQIVELTSLSTNESFPSNETINKFLGLHLLYDYIITGNNEVFEQLYEANAAVLLIYILKGEVGSQSHIDAFHTMYYSRMSAHALSMIDKIIELDNDYNLDSDTTGNLINFHYNEATLYILLFATTFDFESTELTEAVASNLKDIYQGAINLLVETGHMEPFELYLYTD